MKFQNLLEPSEPAPPSVFPWRMMPGGRGRFLAFHAHVVDQDLEANTSTVRWTLSFGL